MTGVSLHGETPGRGLAADLLISLRPDQWTKNLVVFAGLVFGEQLLEPGAVARAGGAFGIFCALSSAMYLVNDVGDRARDRLHPLKSGRPIAAGRVSPASALGAAVLLIAGAVTSAFLLEPRLALLALVFVGVLILYSPLVVWAPFASNVYHDWLWYPTVGQSRIRAFSRTEWGRLWATYREATDGTK